MYNFEPIITKEFILKHISQEQIFQYYLDHSTIELKKKNYTNTLRNDSNPDCSYDIGSYGDLMFRDFALGKSYSCIQIVQVKYGLNFQQSLNKIASDFKLIENDKNFNSSNSNNIASNCGIFPVSNFSINNEINRRITEIKVKKVDWNVDNIKYWSEYSITEQYLNKYKVSNLSHYWLENDKETLFYCKPNSVYSYYLGMYENVHRYKLLNIKNEKFKWINNCDANVLQGYNQLNKNGDLLVITKSLKDCICLNMLGYNVVAPQNEGILIPNNLMDELKQRFTHQILLLDNDLVGVEHSFKQSELYNIPCLFIPKERGKDVSDVVKAEGIQNTSNLIKTLFNL